MKFAYTILFILVTLIIISGCSSSDSEKTENKIIVRKTIENPVQEKSKKAEANTMDTSRESQVQEEKTPVNEQEKNIYITKEGDTLSGISAAPHIYNNFLKWPILYRDNREILSKIKKKSDLSEISLSTGTRLKIKTPAEVSENLDNRARHYYIINVASSPSMEKLTPMIVSLIGNGYFIYLSSTEVDGKEWFRLRTGFYENRSEAKRKGNKIKDSLNIQDIWTAKIDDDEFLDFGGY